MIRSRLGSLGIGAVILCTFALAVTGAHAETGANWSILTSGGEFKTGGELKASINGEMEGFGSLLTEVSKVLVDISCSSGAASGMNLGASGSLSGKVEFSGCSTRLNGSTSSPCKPHSTGSFSGTIVTSSLKGLLVLFLGEANVRIEPSAGETFVTVVLGTEGESECAIGEFLPVRGKVYLEDGEMTTWQNTHLVRESFLPTDVWVLNKTVEHNAIFDGSGTARLSSVHEGLIWSGQPG